ncbi:hypothetical protein, partial [Escherichia coli]|uniref:hypothetical protein n=1 Tax=Escherichia coli TaxID=562 RepID=UPI0021D38081
VSNDLNGTSVLPKLSSTEASIGTITATTTNSVALNITGASSLASVVASGNVKSISVETPVIFNAGGVEISNDTTITGNLTVSGVLTPGSIDLATTDINAKSITTTEGANIGGDLVVSGTVDLSSADVTVKSLTSAETINSTGVITVSDSVNSSTLPKLISTDATIGSVRAATIEATGNSRLQSVSATQVTATSAEFSGGGLGLQVDN